MDATIYKANTVIDSPTNLKYWSFIPFDTGAYIQMDYPASANNSRAIIVKVISINGELTKQSASSYCTLTLDRSYIVGSDTIYEYTIDTGSVTGCWFALYPANACTKVLIEAREELRLCHTSKMYYSTECFLMHAPRVAAPTPINYAGNTYVISGSCYNNYISYNMPDKEAPIIDDFIPVLPYYSCITFSNKNVEGNIETIAQHIKVDQEMYSNKSQYSAMRVYLNNTRVGGSVEDFYSILKTRRSAKWICQLYVRGSKTTGSGDYSGNAPYVKCDENGDFSFYNDWLSLVQSVPQNS